MFHVMFLLVVISTTDHVASDGYVNDWDEPFNFNCPDGQALSYISSVHSNRKEDRRWEFVCRAVGPTISCIDSGYVNNFNEPVKFSCPGDKVMTGAHGYHSNRHEDRRFGFHCCEIKGRQPKDCSTTDYVNKWDKKLALVVPEGKAIIGAFSHHNNHYEDRRWQYKICTI